MPTFALAFPCELVVILDRVAHAVCKKRLHTAVLNVWLGSAPVRVTCAVVPEIMADPTPGEFPVT